MRKLTVDLFLKQYFVRNKYCNRELCKIWVLFITLGLGPLLGESKPMGFPDPAHSASASSSAQNANVSIHVTDTDGSTLSGASIIIKGAKAGVQTDQNGNAELLDLPANAILIISFTGYETQEVAVAGKTSLNIQLELAVSGLKNVVVTAFGIKREAKSLGYSAAHVGGNDLARSQPVNVANGLSGKVSGLNINLTNSGVDPNNLRITLRGNRSFLGNNQPLIVVDGVPVDNSYLAQMNPNDVESMDILKGATGSALYGSQAANGVMIVTTKKGKKGNLVVNLNSSITLEQVSFAPKLQYEFGASSSEFESGDAISYSSPYNFQNAYVPYENQSFGAPFSSGSPFGGDSIIIGMPSADGKIQRIPYKAYPNEFKKFWNTGLSKQNGVSMSSGDDKGDLFISAQNITRTGITPGDEYTRNTVKFSGSRKYGILKIMANVSYNASKIDVGNLFNAYNSIANIAPNIPYTNYKDIDQPFSDINTYYNAYGINPYWYLKHQRDVSNRQDLVGNVELSLDATKWLNIDYVAGINNYYNTQQSTTAAFNYTPFAVYMGNNTIGGNMSIFHGNSLPVVASTNSSTNKFYSNLRVSLHKTIGELKSQIILGNVVNQDKSNSLSNGSTTLLNIDDFYNINYRQGVPSVNQFRSMQRSIGNFADVSFAYKNTFFLHGSGRIDATSLLNASFRSYFYPGVDAAVVVSDLFKGLKNSQTISYLKLRAAMTKTGNVNVAPYQIQNIFLAGAGFPFGQLPGLTTSSSSAFPDLKPEFTFSKEFGTDIGFFNNRINLQATYFLEKTTNETVPINISSSTGYTSSLVNVGRMDNKGLELELRLAVLQLKNGFKWDVGINYTHYQNKVVSLGAVNSLAINNSNGVASNAFAVVGSAYPSLLLNDWLRDSSGRVIVDPNSGYGKVNPKLVNFGSSNPTNTLGITSTASYKGFSLSVVAEYKAGNVIFNRMGTDLDQLGVSARSAVFAHTRYVMPNSSYQSAGGGYLPNNNIQITDGGISGWNFPNSMYMTSGAYWTINNVTLSYNFPNHLLNKIKYVKNISLSLVGSNLLLFVPNSNVWTNPGFGETTGNATGTSSLHQSPPTRIFGANLNITF